MSDESADRKRKRATSTTPHRDEWRLSRQREHSRAHRIRRKQAKLESDKRVAEIQAQSAERIASINAQTSARKFQSLSQGLNASYQQSDQSMFQQINPFAVMFAGQQFGAYDDDCDDDYDDDYEFNDEYDYRYENDQQGAPYYQQRTPYYQQHPTSIASVAPHPHASPAPSSMQQQFRHHPSIMDMVANGPDFPTAPHDLGPANADATIHCQSPPRIRRQILRVTRPPSISSPSTSTAVVHQSNNSSITNYEYNPAAACIQSNSNSNSNSNSAAIQSKSHLDELRETAMLLLELNHGPSEAPGYPEGAQEIEPVTATATVAAQASSNGPATASTTSEQLVQEVHFSTEQPPAPSATATATATSFAPSSTEVSTSASALQVVAVCGHNKCHVDPGHRSKSSCPPRFHTADGPALTTSASPTTNIPAALAEAGAEDADADADATMEEATVAAEQKTTVEPQPQPQPPFAGANDQDNEGLQSTMPMELDNKNSEDVTMEEADAAKLHQGAQPAVNPPVAAFQPQPPFASANDQDHEEPTMPMELDNKNSEDVTMEEANAAEEHQGGQPIVDPPVAAVHPASFQLVPVQQPPVDDGASLQLEEPVAATPPHRNADTNGESSRALVRHQGGTMQLRGTPPSTPPVHHHGGMMQLYRTPPCTPRSTPRRSTPLFMRMQQILVTMDGEPTEENKRMALEIAEKEANQARKEKELAFGTYQKQMHHQDDLNLRAQQHNNELVLQDIHFEQQQEVHNKKEIRSKVEAGKDDKWHTTTRLCALDWILSITALIINFLLSLYYNFCPRISAWSPLQGLAPVKLMSMMNSATNFIGKYTSAVSNETCYLDMLAIVSVFGFVVGVAGFAFNWLSSGVKKGLEYLFLFVVFIFCKVVLVEETSDWYLRETPWFTSALFLFLSWLFSHIFAADYLKKDPSSKELQEAYDKFNQKNEYLFRVQVAYTFLKVAFVGVVYLSRW